MKRLLLVFLLIQPALIFAHEPKVLSAAKEYIIRKHDEKARCNPCLTAARARRYAKAIHSSAHKYGVPFDVLVGLIGWESGGFINTVDKQGSGSKILPVYLWCWGMGKLKVSTANDFARNFLGWDVPYITGRELLYNVEMNIELSAAYLAWCLRLKGGDLRRALNAYKAGPSGETAGKFWIVVRMPWGAERRMQYAEAVIEYSMVPWEKFKESREVAP